MASCRREPRQADSGPDRTAQAVAARTTEAEDGLCINEQEATGRPEHKAEQPDRRKAGGGFGEAVMVKALVPAFQSEVKQLSKEKRPPLLIALVRSDQQIRTLPWREFCTVSSARGT